MAFINGVTFDLSKVHFAADTKPNKSGGRNVRVSRDEASGARVQFQLGKRRADAMRCPWGLDKTSKDASDDDTRKILKIEVSGKEKQAIERLEEATVAAAFANSESWFKEKKPLSKEAVQDRFQSKLKTDDKGITTLTLKVDTDGDKKTVVKVCHVDEDGSYSKPVVGSHKDITKGCKAVPNIFIGNGVYFINKNFGTSLVASEITVVAGDNEESTTYFSSDEDAAED